MHIVENKSKSGKKIYRSILLRESYREDGKVKKRTIANLSNCTPQEIGAIKLALNHKEDLGELGSLSESIELHEGLSVGAVWCVNQVARELGIEEALGKDFQGKLAMWQVIARVMDQGSRLSAVRLAQVHAVGDVLDMKRGFDENDLYGNLAWLAENQGKIEQKLFESRRGEKKPKLFLYDVTSSYLEGEQNHFGEYGYNRDGKKGKKQIVIGLLCDEQGDAVSTEVFTGNTQDTQTFVPQVTWVQIKEEGGILKIESDEEAMKEESTRGHVFVVMLAYMIIRRLRKAWEGFDLTVEGGLEQLATVCSMEVKVKGQDTRCLKIPQPREQSRRLLETLKIKLPEALPKRDIRVVTRKKLPERRKAQ